MGFLGLKEFNSWTGSLGYSYGFNEKLDLESILKLRDTARPFLYCKVGSGNHTSFWQDDWTNLGPLINLSGTNGLRVTRISRIATVAQATLDNSWNLPRGRYPVIVLLKACLPMVSVLTPNTPNVFLWRNSNTSPPGQFSSSLTWNCLHPVTDIVSWWKSIWFPTTFRNMPSSCG